MDGITKVTGTAGNDTLTAGANNQILDGGGGGDTLSNGGNTGVVFEYDGYNDAGNDASNPYGSFTQLQQEVMGNNGDTINGGNYANAASGQSAFTGNSVGLGSNDVLKLNFTIYQNGNAVTSDISGGSIISNYANTATEGEAGLFNVGGNVVFALNAGTGNQNFGSGNDTSDIYFDVEDDMTSWAYDVSELAITFA